ncbi:MAG: ABC transporter permease, partial [Oscillospiraceae bacterium]|nr:ABC transporter permease [Oscillospiraceae bacterium]
MKKWIALTVKDLVRSKQSLLLLFGMLFAFLLPMVLFSVSSSFVAVAKEKAYSVYGRFDAILYHAQNHAEHLTFEGNASGDLPFPFRGDVGTVTIVREIGDTFNDQVAFGYFDETARFLGDVEVVDGRFPTNIGEICLSQAVLHRLHIDQQMEEEIQVGGKSYRLVGVFRDNSVNWSRSPQEEQIYFPNALVSKAEVSENHAGREKHLLLQQYEARIPREIYQANVNLVENTNLVKNDGSSKYNVPTIVYVLTSACSFLLMLYLFLLYTERLQKKIAVMRCLGLTKRKGFLWLLTEIVELLLVAFPIGLFFAFLISFGVVQIFNLAFENNMQFVFRSDYVLVSASIGLLSIATSLLFMRKRLSEISPIEAFRSTSSRGKRHTKVRKTRKVTLLQLSWIKTKAHLQASLVVILLIACSLSLFHFFSVYMNLFSARKAEVEGQMPQTFDYEFVTNQTVVDSEYTDENGNLNKVLTIPDENSVYFLPDYRKTLPADTLADLKKTSQIERIDQYLEANFLFLMDAPDPAQNPYLNGFSNDSLIGSVVCDIFGVKGTTRGLHMLGYSEKELRQIASKANGDGVNWAHIKSGEEAILMVPIYEFTDLGGGYTQQDFISESQYKNKGNQFKDTAYSVGDTLVFTQFVPKDETIHGYVTSEVMRTSVTQETFQIKIGAIVYQRVAWFNNATLPPSAYSLLVLNESFRSMGVLPTHDRIRITLKPNVSYREFDSIIYDYANQLRSFDFRNNAAEMQEFREFKVLLNTLYVFLVSLVALFATFILIIEERMKIATYREFYSLLRINALSLAEIKRLIVAQAALFSLIGILLSVPIVFAVIQSVFLPLSDLYQQINYFASVFAF